MDKLLELAIAYPDFQLNQIIDPEQVDLNNSQMVSKINYLIKSINVFSQGTTGATNVGITPLTQFADATSVQTALDKINAYCKATSTTLTEILAKNATQETRITTNETNIATATTKNNAQDASITSLTTRMTAEETKSATMGTAITSIEAKNVAQDTRLTTNEAKNVAQDTRLNDLEVKATLQEGLTSNNTLSIGDLYTNTYRKLEADQKLAEHQGIGHDERYYKKDETYTKTEIGQFLTGGDTSIVYEVYTIVNPLITDANGVKTFTYKDNFGNTYTGNIGTNGEQIFTLIRGFVTPGLNRIEVSVNDSKTRSVASGGLIEMTETKMALVTPEVAGTELTFKYYQRIDLQGQYQVYLGEVEPPFETSTLWLKIL